MIRAGRPVAGPSPSSSSPGLPPASLLDVDDHEQHAALLEKFGIDPGKLAEKAAKERLASLEG